MKPVEPPGWKWCSRCDTVQRLVEFDATGGPKVSTFTLSGTHRKSNRRPSTICRSCRAAEARNRRARAREA